MARRPSNVSDEKKTVEQQFNDKAFVDGVFNDEYMLVVGSGVILNPNSFNECGGDINKYIINEINSDRRKKRVGFVDHKDFTDVYRGTPLNEVDPIYSLLSDNFDYDIEDMSVELKELVRTRLFRFVLTTTIDAYLETLMKEVWGDELRIVNISDNQSLKDFQDALEKSRVNKYTQPTLFYVFGKVIPGRPQPKGFVETDVDAIKIIEKWMTDVDSRQIIPFLKSKRILALGCKFDDWYFRFFWYILTRRFEHYNDTGIDTGIMSSDNLAAVFKPDNDSDKRLKEYLKRRGVRVHENVWQFMKMVYKVLTDTDSGSPMSQMVTEKRRQGGIFISYKNTDVMMASELFCKLAREKGLNVWFDNMSLKGGDNYNESIMAAIRQAKVFIPLLSQSVAEDLRTEGTGINSFYSREWRCAAENSHIAIIPVAVGGYDLRGSEHAVFEQIVQQHPSGIDMTYKPVNPRSPEKVGYAKLLESIMKHLGI